MTNVDPKRTLNDYLLAKMETIVRTYEMDGPSPVLQVDKESINYEFDPYPLPDPTQVWWTDVPPVGRAVSSTKDVVDPVLKVAYDATSLRKFKEYLNHIVESASTKRTWKKQGSIVQICANTARLSETASTRGWKIFLITIETGFDLLTDRGRQLAWKRLVKGKPDVIVFEFMCDPWSVMQNVSLAKSEDFAAQLRAIRVRHLAMLRWISRV